jgi:hypothetical protein
MTDFVAAASQKHPMALEETLYNLVLDVLEANPVVILDDLHCSIFIPPAVTFIRAPGISTR